MSSPTDDDHPSSALLSSYIRPIIILICTLLLYNLPTLIHKSKLTLLGIVYFFLCNDKSWKKPRDPWAKISPLLATAEGKKQLRTKTIIFVRHGESTWNETFNKGPHRSLGVFVLFFVPNLIKALVYEFYLLLSGKMDSWFYDSPLSHLGLSQIQQLSDFLSPTTVPTAATTTPIEKRYISILRGDKNDPSSSDSSPLPTSILLSSSLRRALSTVAIAFRDRLARNPEEKILVVPQLQEISRNPDTLSLTPAYAPVTASWIDKENSHVVPFQKLFDERVDMSHHGGNKPLDTNGLKRMLSFCEMAFSEDEVVKDVDVLICGGHSIWFRSFFRTFLPYEIDHAAKTKKVVNGGCVAFQLIEAKFPNEETCYVIDPKSLVVIYGGFN